MFAREGTSDGSSRCPSPCRAMKATRRPSIVPATIGPLGAPNGVSTLEPLGVAQLLELVEAGPPDDADLCRRHAASLVRHQRRYPVRGQPVASAELGELDDEGEARDLAAEAGDELRRRLGGAARRDQVVDDRDAVAVHRGVAVQLERGALPYSSS